MIIKEKIMKLHIGKGGHNTAERYKMYTTSPIKN